MDERPTHREQLMRTAALATCTAALLALTGCTTTPAPGAVSAPPATVRSTTPTVVDTTSPLETITDLPHDAEEINRIMYGRLVEQWRPVLAAFGTPPTEAIFTITGAGSGYDGSRAGITVSFGPRTLAEGVPLENAMAATVRKLGWQPIGALSMLNVRKDGYYLRGGCTNDDCYWIIESSLIPEQGIAGGDWQGKTVPELLHH